MYIQLNHVNYINKGAELMLRAIIDRLSREKELNPIFVFGDMFYTDDVRKNGLLRLLRIEKFGINFANLFPNRKLLKFGFVKPKKIDLIIDAAGWNFRDIPHSPLFKDLDEEVNYYKQLKSNNRKIILLPQGFGPFEHKESRERIIRISQYIDLLYARDSLSYEYLLSVLGRQEKIRTAPDFTNIYEPRVYADIIDKARNSVIFIPNEKMITHTDGEISDSYLDFYVELYRTTVGYGKKMYLLNHEGDGDRKVLSILKEKLNCEVEIFDFMSADEIKTMIGNSYLTITSRFHGAVSALCQAVPVFVTSWGHKYEMLLNDYDQKDALLDVLKIDEAKKKIAYAMNEDNNKQIRIKLVQNSIQQKELTNIMWDEVIRFAKQTARE